jgi:hypothetical protein
MIKKEELRLGNKIMFDNLNKRHPQQRIVEVKELLEKEVVVIDPVGLDLKLFYNSENVKPIRITPDILRKCGFKDAYTSFHDGVHIANLKKDGFELQYHSEIQDGIVVSAPQSDDGFVAHCPYLHNLQNLFFVLQGQELNYNPHGK